MDHRSGSAPARGAPRPAGEVVAHRVMSDEWRVMSEKKIKISPMCFMWFVVFCLLVTGHWPLVTKSQWQ